MFKPKKVQRFHSLQKIQDGGVGNSQGVVAPKRLASEGGYERCISPRASSKSFSKIPTISVEGGKMEVCMLAVRATKRPPSFYKNNATSFGPPKGERDKSSMLSRRHPNLISLKGGRIKGLSNSSKNTTKPRVFTKREKIGTRSDTKDGVFGDFGRLKENGVECTQEKVKEIPQGSEEVSQKIKASSLHYIKAIGGFSRQAKLNCPGHGRHRATYSGPSVGPRKGVKGSPPKSHDVEQKSVVTSTSICDGGPRVVGPKGTALERKVGVAKKLTGPCDFDRRKRHRLCGSPPTGSQTSYCDPGELDSKRGGHPIYKLKGARSYLSDGFRFGKTQKMEKQKDSCLDRQYGVQVGGEQKHSQTARHVSHPGADENFIEFAQDSIGSQSYPRKRQHCGGLRKPPEVRNRGLEAAPSLVHHVATGLGTALHRLDGIQTERPTAPFLQLDVRPKGNIHRCVKVLTPERKWVFKSPILSHRKAPPARSDQGGYHDNCGSYVEDTTMVARTDKYVRGLSNNVVRQNNITKCISSSSSIHTTHIHPSRLSGGHDHTPTGVGGSRLSHIRQGLSKQGFSEKVLDRLSSAWKSSTVDSYESPWSAWQNHCSRKGIDFSDPSPVNFVSFLEEVFQKGRSYSHCNTTASSVATALHLSSGVNLTENPVVSLFRKALRNERPPTPKYIDTWDVGVVFRYISSLGINSSLSLTVLTRKSIVLFKLDLMGRGSDLSKAFRNQLQFLDSGSCRIRLYATKENGKSTKFSRGKWTTWIEVGAYLYNRRICTVTTLKAYIKRTTSSEYANDIRVEGKQTRGLFASVVRASSGSSKGLFWSLSSQRISKYALEGMSEAGIDVKKYGAHSTRSAALSMATDAGADVGKVLRHARLASRKTFETFYYRSVERFVKKKVSASSSLAYFVRASV